MLINLSTDTSAAEKLAAADAFIKENAARAMASPWYPGYHIASQSGWINDPNGCCVWRGVYHVFYQLHPYSPNWGPMHWGHVHSTDLVHWVHDPVAMAPGGPGEAGCFSGCAVPFEEELRLYYTAHDGKQAVKQTQYMASSADGIHFEKSPLNPLIPIFPEDGSKDFRDPQVFAGERGYYMILASGKDGIGKVLLYRSDDMLAWDYAGVLFESDGTMGDIWECTNLLRIEGKDLLLFSPMGMDKHKSIYLVGRFDESLGHFIAETGPRETDFGESFYAAQLFMDADRRSLLFAWMGRGRVYAPCQEDGFMGNLTLPRVLHLSEDLQLLQEPAPELADLRLEEVFSYDSERADGSALNVAFDCEHAEENSLAAIGHGRKLEIRFTLRRDPEAAPFRLDFYVDETTGDRASLFYDPAENKVCMAPVYGSYDDIPAIAAAAADATGFSEIVHPLSEGPEEIDFALYLDNGIAELFADGGRLTISQQYFPPVDAAGIRIAVPCAAAKDGNTEIKTTSQGNMLKNLHLYTLEPHAVSDGYDR